MRPAHPEKRSSWSSAGPVLVGAEAFEPRDKRSQLMQQPAHTALAVGKCRSLGLHGCATPAVGLSSASRCAVPLKTDSLLGFSNVVGSATIVRRGWTGRETKWIRSS